MNSNAFDSNNIGTADIAAPASKYNLPTTTISAAELARTLPKAKRIGKISRIDLSPPPEELMAELRSLVAQLNPNDRHPDFHKSKVVAAIFNETLGHPDGFELANSWCNEARTYPGRDAFWKYWKGLNLKHKNPATIRTLRWMVAQKDGQ